jgi:hypothetical protein
MGIALMTHIPYYFILGGIEDPVQGDGKLHHSQIGGQMAPVPAYDRDDPLPNLSGKTVQFSIGKGTKILRAPDLRQKGFAFMHHTTTIFPNQVLKAARTLFVLVSVLSKFFLALMGCNLSKFTLSSAGHFKISLNIAVGNKLEGQYESAWLKGQEPGLGISALSVPDPRLTILIK